MRFSLTSPARLVTFSISGPALIHSGSRISVKMNALVLTAAAYSRAAMTRILRKDGFSLQVDALHVWRRDAHEDVLQAGVRLLEVRHPPAPHQRLQQRLAVALLAEAQLLRLAEVGDAHHARQVARPQ